MADLSTLLMQSIAGQDLTIEQWQQLVQWEFVDERRACAWQISPGNVEDCLRERLAWLHRMVVFHDRLPLPPQPLESYLSLYWHLWLPLACWLKTARKQQATPLIAGFLGGQGTGKTTLTQILQRILKEMGHNTVGWSIDDLYKTFQDRQQLKQSDPRLIWRGPPGTHDVDLGIMTLQHLRQAQPEQTVSLPRFDKSLHGGEGDQIEPERVKNIDIVLFEGWFLGVRPVPLERFDEPLPLPIETRADRLFARDMNEQLRDYLPLWQLLDRLIVLTPQDYRLSQAWRRQAENQMKSQGKAGMSDETVNEFVEYFWKALHPDLFIAPLKTAGGGADLVIELAANRTPQAIYIPGSG